MHALIGIAVIMMFFVGFYFYHYIKRTVTFWYHGKITKWIKVVIVLGSVFLAVGCINPFGVPTLVIYHILGISIVLEVIHGILHGIEKRKRKEFPVWEKVFRSGLVPLMITAIVLVYGYMNMLDVREKTYEVSTEKHLSNQKGYHIAFLSDLHFGTTMNAEKLQKYCDEIGSKNPDLVILGGDIVDERTSKEDMEQSLQILGGIKNKYGVFYVYGNHDSASYSNSPNFTMDDLNRSLKESGIQCIADKTHLVNQDLLLVGRDDKGYGKESMRKSTKQLLKGQNQDRCILLVDHQPMELKENAKAGVDLQLSGHTHGGQIWPVGLISDLLGFGEMNYGEKQIGKDTIIVSSGIAGWGYAIRTGHHSEYLMIHIEGN